MKHLYLLRSEDFPKGIVKIFVTEDDEDKVMNIHSRLYKNPYLIRCKLKNDKSARNVMALLKRYDESIDYFYRCGVNVSEEEFKEFLEEITDLIDRLDVCVDKVAWNNKEKVTENESDFEELNVQSETDNDKLEEIFKSALECVQEVKSFNVTNSKDFVRQVLDGFDNNDLHTIGILVKFILHSEDFNDEQKNLFKTFISELMKESNKERREIMSEEFVKELFEKDNEEIFKSTLECVQEMKSFYMIDSKDFIDQVNGIENENHISIIENLVKFILNSKKFNADQKNLFMKFAIAMDKCNEERRKSLCEEFVKELFVEKDNKLEKEKEFYKNKSKTGKNNKFMAAKEREDLKNIDKLNYIQLAEHANKYKDTVFDDNVVMPAEALDIGAAYASVDDGISIGEYLEKCEDEGDVSDESDNSDEFDDDKYIIITLIKNKLLDKYTYIEGKSKSLINREYMKEILLDTEMYLPIGAMNKEIVREILVKKLDKCEKLNTNVFNTIVTNIQTFINDDTGEELIVVGPNDIEVRKKSIVSKFVNKECIRCEGSKIYSNALFENFMEYLIRKKPTMKVYFNKNNFTPLVKLNGYETKRDKYGIYWKNMKLLNDNNRLLYDRFIPTQPDVDKLRLIDRL